jgi:hypothetical protein
MQGEIVNNQKFNQFVKTSYSTSGLYYKHITTTNDD